MLKKTLAMKMLTGFFVVMFIGLIASGVTLYNLSKNGRAISFVDENDLPHLEKTAQLAANAADMVAAFQSFIMTGNESFWQSYEQLGQRNEEIVAELEKTSTTEEARQMAQQIKQLQANYQEVIKRAALLKRSGHDQEAQQMLLSEAAPQYKALQAQINAYWKLRQKQISEGFHLIIDGQQSTIWLVGILGLLSVIASVAIGLFVARMITRPVKNLMAAAEKLAVGDVNVHAVAETQDEIGALVQSFGKMVESIREQALAAERIAMGDITAQIKVRSEQDVLGKNLSKCIANINLLVNDINGLAGAAVEGRLAARADASKHGGDYRKIVEGVNETLDKVIAPVKEASAALQEMAEGNLQVRVEGEYKGDHAAIKNAMNETLEALNHAFGEIANIAEQVAAGSEQIAASGQALSQGSTEQAASIEEITATMVQVAAQTKQNALNASQANELATQAKDRAVEGNAQMQEMVKAMVEINDSSANISKIIKVIDEIAFQTNILALNAAVEAARAGQHGKGFAVVAEEVRNLAARSANAAKETTAMIEGSIKKVEVGTKIANQTAVALDTIVEGVTRAAALVGDIADASNEQATAISQVNQAIVQVSQVVQTNSATAEESASASEELSNQAALMKENVHRFKLKQTGGKLGKDVSEDVLRALENMMEKKKAKPSSRVQIMLDANDYGKY